MRFVIPVGNLPLTSASALLNYADLPDHRLRGRTCREALRLAQRVLAVRPYGLAEPTAQQYADRETALLNAAVLLLRLQELPEAQRSPSARPVRIPHRRQVA